MNNESNGDWLRQVRQALEDSAASMDAATLSKLNQARQRALGARHRSNYWLPLSALGATTTAGFAIILWWQTPPQAEPDIWEDFEIVASQADLDFYRELEFYQWLDGEDAG